MVLVRQIPGETNIDLCAKDDNPPTSYWGGKPPTYTYVLSDPKFLKDYKEVEKVVRERDELIASLYSDLVLEREFRKEMVNVYRTVLQFLEHDGHARLAPGLVALVEDMIRKGSK